MATIQGTQGNDALTGTTDADSILGLGGDDTINGGLGNDTMEGGDGNDTYVIGDIGDIVVENAAENQSGALGDLIYIDVPNYALSSGLVVPTFTSFANVEAVSALNQAGTEAFNIQAVATTRTIVGNAGVNTLSGSTAVAANGLAQTLIGLAGNDTYNVYAANQVAQEAANGGTDTLNVQFGQGAFGVAGATQVYNLTAGSSIEVVNLAAAGRVTGNELVQTINGSAGNDTLDGGGGLDYLNAGGGDDVIAVSSGVRVSGGAGTDRVISSTEYALVGLTGVVNTGVEFLELAGRTNVTAATTVLAANLATTSNYLVGDQGAQVIIGDNGTNTLLGAPTATGAGNDTLIGLGGNDVYRVYAQGDVVLEGSTTAGADTGGFDTIYTSVTYSLLTNDTNAQAYLAGAGATLFTDAAAIQQIEVLSTADQAGTTAINLTGNTLAQTIIGNAGANVLNDGGGAGVDKLIGLGGDDTYLVSVSSTFIQEAVGGGNDTVLLQNGLTTYVLTAGAEVELITTPASGLAYNLTGNEFGQRIVGDTANDTIVGGGGADTLSGLAGNDTYTVDSLDDVIIEAVGNGTDTVLSINSYALNAGAEVEILRGAPYNGASTTLATRSSSTANTYLVGNEFAQLITGTAGDNTILGSAAANGNAGVNDTLAGLAGNDTYRVFSATDVVVEGTGAANGTNDVIFTNVNYSLLDNAGRALTFVNGLATVPTDGPTATVGNIETLSAADQASTTALTLLGDAGNNTIIGNNGSNVLGGGAGNDVLIGLGRGDNFYFDTAGAANADTIRDFNAVNGGDHLLLLTTFFTGLNANAAGTVLADSSFRLSNDTQAQTTTPTIVYDQATGQIFYDNNGTANVNPGGEAGGLFLIATITPGTSVVASDIFLTATAPTI